ncbi:MAG: pitrilysin family protein [Saprospiraceae bacterium]|nr:insulinase family protein [Saprospiraceae bacterium]MDW8229599.1 pitrilysin family protein [Saprospiraceae bacterium]
MRIKRECFTFGRLLSAFGNAGGVGRLDFLYWFAVRNMKPPSRRSSKRNAPLIRPVGPLRLPRPERLFLDNGMPLYVLHFPEREILKVEVVYRAGRPQESKPLVARATSRLVREGTRHRSAAELAEYLDFYGAGLGIPVNLDFSAYALFGLHRYRRELLPVFAEMLHEPAFPEEELETFKRNNIQELLIELDKPEVMTYRCLTECIFGAEHPYGYNSSAEGYAALQRDDLVQHFERWFTPANGLLIACGHVDDDVLRLLNNTFGQQPARPAPPPTRWTVTERPPQSVHLPQPKAHQTAIKVGRRMFNRRHPDYNAFVVLNIVLGGYFGSRLMTNLREKRGLTYGVYSSLDALALDGYFYIAAEVHDQKAPVALREIFAEMQRLQDEPIPEAELDMVRNYLSGMLLNGIDGPLNISDLVRTFVAEDLPFDAFDAQVQAIQTIDAQTLQHLAQQYLNPNDYWVVTAGKHPVYTRK